MFISNEQIHKELQEVKGLLKKILTKEVEHSIEEISLGKAQKLLKMGSDKIIKLVKTGKLKAQTYKDSKRKTRYRFRIADIREYQKSKEYDHISLHSEGYESAKEIADRIFKPNKKAV